MQELQYAKKWVEIVKYRIFIGNFYQYLLFRQHSDGMKKLDQAVKDVEYYRQVKPSDLFSLWKLFDTQEAENLRTRYNDVILEKQRLDSEVISLRRFENIFLWLWLHQWCLDSWMKIVRRCMSWGDSSRRCSTLRVDPVNLWASCTELCWENMRQSRRTLQCWAPGSDDQTKYQEYKFIFICS